MNEGLSLDFNEVTLIADALREHITGLVEDLQKEDDPGLLVPIAQDVIDCSKLLEKLEAVESEHQEQSQENAQSAEEEEQENENGGDDD
jgi:hypothetical protein